MSITKIEGRIVEIPSTLRYAASNLIINDQLNPLIRAKFFAALVGCVNGEGDEVSYDYASSIRYMTHSRTMHYVGTMLSLYLNKCSDVIDDIHSNGITRKGPFPHTIFKLENGDALTTLFIEDLINETVVKTHCRGIDSMKPAASGSNEPASISMLKKFYRLLQIIEYSMSFLQSTTLKLSNGIDISAVFDNEIFKEGKLENVFSYRLRPMSRNDEIGVPASTIPMEKYNSIAVDKNAAATVADLISTRTDLARFSSTHYSQEILRFPEVTPAGEEYAAFWLKEIEEKYMIEHTPI